MGVCDFHLQASSALLPGRLLEGLLESMLEKSTRRAVVWHGNATSQKRLRESAQLEKSSSKNHNRQEQERRWLSCLRDSPLFQHARYCSGLSRDRRAEGIVHPDAFRLCRQLHPGCDEG